MEDWTYYPSELWNRSHTYKRYVRLSIADIHRLHRLDGPTAARKDEPGGSVFYMLNHPIRWVQVVGRIVVAEAREQKDLIVLDDGSSATVDIWIGEEKIRKSILLTRDDEDLWIQPKKRQEVALCPGDCIKIKGELMQTWYGVRQVEVFELERLHDPNLELQFWRTRLSFRQAVLEKSWVATEEQLASYRAIIRKRNKSKSKQRNQEKKGLPDDKSALAIFKNHLLRHLQERELRRFSMLDVVETGTNVMDLARTTASKQLSFLLDQGLDASVSDEAAQKTIQKALRALLEEGRIIRLDGNGSHKVFVRAVPDLEAEYLLVGEWNLGHTIRAEAKSSGQVDVTSLWLRIQSWRNGWETITKQIVGETVREVLGNDAVLGDG